jgi:hypothetical protein
VLKVIYLRKEKKVGDEDIKGRVYTLNRNDFTNIIYVPTSNMPPLRV